MGLRCSPSRFLSATTLFVLSIAAGAQRLPGGVHPDHYSLLLTPDLKAATFAGEETIDLTLDAATASITLNAAEIHFVAVKAGSQAALVSLDADKEQATFSFAQALPAGKAQLSISYTGILNDKLRGFYLSKTPRRNYAVTQFEPTDARRAFPSFDEPALKATYDISLMIDKNDTAISNTQIISDTEGPMPGKHTLRFATTPKMSSYLAAFLVGDFECSKGKSDGVPIRVCGTPDKVKYTRFAVEAAEHILHYYNTYFGIKYPMPKLDMVGLPDFEAGAMENFGCITYRETDLLVDSKDGSVPAKKQVASVVAHEMAHQWFGDMVTMQWWDNLWLNEGFATWMESKPVAAWHPEWNIALDEVHELNDTLDYDAEATTRTIRARADTPDEINEMFDGISYGKAGAVLGMVESYIGEETFRQGVHNYLSAHLYANATAEDFWNAQVSVSHRPVDRIMDSFVSQPGVPQLAFGEDPKHGFTVRQSRFFISTAATASRQQAWTLPVCLPAMGLAGCQLAASGRQALQRGSRPPVTFAGSGAKGYYRSTYTQAQYQSILQSLTSTLTPAERILFLGERWAVVRSGQGKIGEYLNLVQLLRYDTHAPVLDTAANTLISIENHVLSEGDRPRLKDWVREQFLPVYQELGKQGRHENFDRQDLRSTLFGLLGWARDPGVLAEAREIVEQTFRGKAKADPSTTGMAFSLTATDGRPEFYERILKVSQVMHDPGLKMDFQRMLARFHDPVLVNKTLEYAVSGQVRTQDNWILLSLLLSQRDTQAQAWKFIRENWPKVQAQLTTTSGARIVSATGYLCTQAEREEVKTFFTEHKVDAAERTLKKALDSIDACIALRASQQRALTNWLDEVQVKR